MKKHQNMTESPGSPARQAAVNTPERIRALIEREIESGNLLPGMPLDEKSLAEAYEVSRTPVREALLMLAAQKLVSIVPRAGTFVHRPDASELIALLECLGEMEGSAARLAAQRLSIAQREHLQALHVRSGTLVQAGDRAGYAAINLQLHDAIHQGCNNVVLAEEITGIRRRLANFRRHVFDQPGRMSASLAEHEAIVRAVCAGDGETASRTMREHIVGKGAAYADLVLANIRPTPGA